MKLRVNARPLSNFFQQKHYVGWLVYGLSIVLVLVLQMSPRLFPAIHHVRPSPLIAFLVCVSVLGGARTGVTVGVISGLMCSIFSSYIFGFEALMFLVIGLVVGLLVEWLLRANFYTALLLSFITILVYGMAEWLFCYVIPGREEITAILLKVILPSGLYTFLLTPLLYWFALALARFVRRYENG